MDNNEFKNMFDEIAKLNGFEKAFGGWFKSSSECIIVLDLQKSNYANYYELNIKIFIQGVFGQNYQKSKELVSKHIGHYFTRQPDCFSDVFNLDKDIDDISRKRQLLSLFADYLVPFSISTLTRKGIIDLEKSNNISLLPAIKRELDIS